MEKELVLGLVTEDQGDHERRGSRWMDNLKTCTGLSTKPLN